MKKRFLIVVLIGLSTAIAFGFGEKQTIKKQIIIEKDNDETKVKVKVIQKDGLLTIEIDKDGKKEVIEIPLDEEFTDSQIKDILKDKGISFNHHKMKDWADCRPKEQNTWLGVQVQSLTDQLRDYFNIKNESGVLISEVIEDSPAEKAKLKAGDVITQINMTEINNPDELKFEIANLAPEDKIEIVVVRKGKIKKLNAVLGEVELKEDAMWFGNRNLPQALGYRFKPKQGHKGNFEFFLETDDESLKNERKELQEEMEILRKEMEKLKEK